MSGAVVRGSIVHPYTGATYVAVHEGVIEVIGRDGRTGRFAADGRWIEGDLREADPHLCGWIAGPRVENHRVGAPPAS